MKKRFGFTLAEVLITLGIIGVVAAMTIPTLIANTNSAKFRSQFKKTISTLNQVGLMSQAQYDVDFGQVTGCGSGDDDNGSNARPSATGATFCGIFNGTLAGHSITVTSPYGTDPAAISLTGKKYYLTLADGSMLVFSGSMEKCSKDIGDDIGDYINDANTGGKCIAYIDVNGATLPNREVLCADDSVTPGGGTCNVPNDAAHMNDIFRVVFHDATVEPATNAARYVLTTAK